MDETNTLILWGIISIILIFIMWRIKFLYKCFIEIIAEIRDISKAENLGGYLKLIQIIFVVPLIIIFILTFIYYWRSEDTVNPITIVFTVVVGWLGFIIARFFGEEAMETTTRLKERFGEISEVIKNYELRVNSSETLVKKYKERLDRLLSYVEYIKRKKSRKVK